MSEVTIQRLRELESSLTERQQKAAMLMAILDGWHPGDDLPLYCWAGYFRDAGMISEAIR